MPLYHRIFSSPLVEKTFHVTVIFLFLLPLLSCGLKKQAMVNSEFSIRDIKSSALGFVNEDDIFRAVALINISNVNGFYPIKAALIVKRPSFLRLELIPFIGTPDFFLTASPDIVKIFIPSKGEFYSGQPTASNWKKFLPWPMDLDDMIMIFTGTYPSLKESKLSYQAHQEDNFWVVEMEAPSGTSQIIWLGENNKLLKMVRKDPTGDELYHVQYTYKDNNDFPEKIEIKMADESASLSVKYSDVKIEKAKDLSVFDLAIPENTREIILE